MVVVVVDVSVLACTETAVGVGVRGGVLGATATSGSWNGLREDWGGVFDLATTTGEQSATDAETAAGDVSICMAMGIVVGTCSTCWVSMVNGGRTAVGCNACGGDRTAIG